MNRPSQNSRRRPRRSAGFTLVELLVVITIIVLVSAVTLPAVIPALTHRQVGEAARILQGAIVGSRDAAIRSNAPRGIRLLVDPVFNGLDPSTNAPTVNAALAFNRFIPLVTPGDYTTGRVTIRTPVGVNYSYYVEGLGGAGNTHPALRIDESVVDTGAGGFPNERTSWFWNIRIGDKIRLNDAGRYYTVVGPAVINPNNPSTLNQNPELFVNIGMPGDQTAFTNTTYMQSAPTPVTVAGQTIYPEFLYVVNGQDDNVDGFVDNGWDGVDNNYNGLIDEFAEWYDTTTATPIEQEQWVGTEIANLLLQQPTLQSDGTYANILPNAKYTISRRPTPVPGGREVTLPGGVVVDATSWASTMGAERSRLPIDPKTLHVDILVNSNGQVVPTTEYSSPSASSGLPFYHFWLTERQDVHQMSDLWGMGTGNTPNANPNTGMSFMLPLPQEAYSSGTMTQTPVLYLQGERSLLTLFTRTGQTTSNTIENFSLTDINAPYYAAQTGAKEAK